MRYPKICPRKEGMEPFTKVGKQVDRDGATYEEEQAWGESEEVYVGHVEYVI